MDHPLPDLFVERLHQIIPDEDFSEVLGTFAAERSITFRLNRCHPEYEAYKETFLAQKLKVESIAWYDDASRCLDREEFLKLRDAQERGLVYQQSLSSMLVAHLLEPAPRETVLDFCAAPGSKTTLICALMQNEGRLIALESVRNRFYKLKSVLKLLHADIAEPVCIDARRYQTTECLFDRILVDAPCSSEGRFYTGNKKTMAYWSLRKIREMRKKQKGLLMSAARSLAPQGRLMYSTCTFAPEENEAVVDWFLRKNDHIEILDVNLPKGIKTYPSISQWNSKHWHEQVNKSIRILPTQQMDGFFMALFQRIK